MRRLGLPKRPKEPAFAHGDWSVRPTPIDPTIRFGMDDPKKKRAGQVS